MQVRLLIAGSRNIATKHKEAVMTILDGLVKRFDIDIAYVISGNARGVDRWGEQWADKRKIPIEKHIAKWDIEGPSAGMTRNTTMVERCDMGFIVWDGSSKGTLDTITKLKASGKPMVCARMAFMVQEFNTLSEEAALKQRAEASGLVLPE